MPAHLSVHADLESTQAANPAARFLTSAIIFAIDSAPERNKLPSSPRPAERAKEREGCVHTYECISRERGHTYSARRLSRLAMRHIERHSSPGKRFDRPPKEEALAQNHKARLPGAKLAHLYRLPYYHASTYASSATSSSNFETLFGGKTFLSGARFSFLCQRHAAANSLDAREIDFYARQIRRENKRATLRS